MDRRTGNVERRDVIRVASVATAAASIEWYDFFIYGTASALVFPALFFPEQSEVTGLLLSFATFGIGFVARPLGGIVFGHFGDVKGRKNALTAALLIMGIASTLIGLMPTHATIGVAAPIGLVCLRFLQGIAVGGQQGGVVLLAVEAAPARQRGLFGSFASVGAPGGILLANLAFLAVSATTSEEALLAWGWRIPFLLSLIPIALALYIHFKLEDTPSFQRLQARQRTTSTGPKRSPLSDALRRYPREIALTTGVYIGINITYYIFVAFVISYGTNESFLGLPSSTMLTAVLIGSAGQFVALPLAGALSDRFGRRPVLMLGAGLLAAFCFVFWPMVNSGSFMLITLALFVGLGLLHSLMYGVQPALFAETFSTEVRYSGVSLGIQIASVLGGAFAPLIATGLVARLGWISIAAYMAVACLISLVSTWALRETRDVPTDPATTEQSEIHEVRK